MAWRRWGKAVARLREPSRRAECAVLFFPVAVTVLAAVALLCGGRVAAWQWWAAVPRLAALGGGAADKARGGGDAPFRPERGVPDGAGL